MSKWLEWQPGDPQIMADSPRIELPKLTKSDFVSFGGALSGGNPIIGGPSQSCPYTLPEGVSFVRYQRRSPPVAVTVCSAVSEPDKFIRIALAQLDARLHHPVQIKAGDSVFDLLSKLADCGLELRLEWP